MNFSVGKQHKPFYEHLKIGGKVWRNDPLNKVKEVLHLKSPELKDDLGEIYRFGYEDLTIIEKEHEYVFWQYCEGS